MAKETQAKAAYKKTRNYLRNIGYPVNVGDKIIKQFMGDKYINLNSAGEHIQANWNEFMQFYSTIKKEYKNLRQHYEEYDDDDFRIGTAGYDADIREALKYTNGSADDF